MTKKRSHTGFVTLWRIVVFDTDDQIVDASGVLVRKAVVDSEFARFTEKNKWRTDATVKVMVAYPEWVFV